MSAANLHTGLSNAEVQAQIAQGKINTYKETTSKSTGEIIKSNTATFYNMLNVCLVSLVALTGHFRNALFFFAILGNTCVGIYQELRAKKTIESMSLLGKTQARVLRDGAEQAVDKGQIVLNDLCILKKGAQIPVDAVIVGEGFIEVDESMLTGEADPVIKQKGDKVFGGSLVLLGQAQAQACAVGRDVYINQLSAEAKTVKIQKSKLQRQINSIIKAATLMLVVVGPFLFIRQLTTVQQQYLIDWQQALLRALTGVIGMVPQGLVLLTSVALTVGVIHLARQRVLT
ncbi:MAG: HAD-IC family P-type ATPase [Oscillospiraceae bacterium]|jgi:cation-transporting ATPase E|nr:HAD-IC family P-type ATPase [Oscillospiraceae bacterium]